MSTPTPDDELRELIADQEWKSAGFRAEIEDEFRKSGIAVENVESITLGQFDVSPEAPEPEWQLCVQDYAWDVTNAMLDDFDCFMRGTIEDLLPEILEKTKQADTVETREQTIDELMAILRESGMLFARSAEQWRKHWETARELRLASRAAIREP